MSSACGCEAPTPGAPEEPEEHRPWWRDAAILLPVLSGVAFIAGLVLEWSGAGLVATVVFWVGLVLGAWTFVPGALRGLFTRGRLGIGLLMTISAIGAVILGYIEEAAALAFLYSIAEALEDKAMDRARAGLRALLKLVPETATIRQGGATVQVEAKDLHPGQVLVVRPGERIATDGIVRTGRSSLDTSAITGESIPVEVGPGDTVSAGSINTSGALEIDATAAGTDNSLTTIVHLVEQAQTEKGARARLADRIAKPLVPGVLVLAVLVAALGSLFGDPELWITRALVVLVAASPCALAIAVPVTVVSAIGAASRFGVVIKSGAAFERLGGIRHLAVDKTGTLTRNQPTVTAVLTTPGLTEDQVLGWAAALEQHSTHPLAAAIIAAAPDAPGAKAVTETAGHGITGRIDGATITVGSPRWLDPGPLAAQVQQLEDQGMTVVIIHRDGTVAGAIGVRDELRPEVPAVVTTLTGQGIGLTMLTGDNARTARAIAAQAGIGDVRAELRPEDKAAAVGQLTGTRPTAMIGDGINDAPALAAAEVGIAMGATGSDAAIESADVAFTGHDLRLIPQALAHARRGRAIMNQNIVLSLLIIGVLLPLAITGMLGLAAVVLVHEVAEVIVIGNGLRAATTRRTALASLTDRQAQRSTVG
ncbi:MULTISPECIES: heavy metal translocating P-type ATPase [Micrococcus]|uniref:heavy metal translocating P-type ATPase n=1 Tax=Micrococcus TaxID=1269 RepID=UPI0001C4FE4D|nr:MULTISPECIES: cation-translocating P-type ATPase [Micrococcus]EFD50435.1 cadmium-exporting ATPase [Micrococcus luteus SK58]EZP25661.1 Cadmium-exporting ATPase [Micrococcus luteus]MCD0180289.1 cadmium-translocating P-type ATPase [Micrococcus luteus]MCM3578630.1 cadmium-translocating P-type ATPase [Micrococcus luteus]MCV7457048.1 cation-translocating P-type ATPase [Micrococcus luteus]